MRQNMLKKQSLEGQVHRSIRLLLAVLLVPALISLGLMLGYAISYGNAASRINAVAELKPVVSRDIPDQLWAVVAGRKDFLSSGAEASVERINRTLEQQMATAESRVELVVARRTMDTLWGYIVRIRDQMASPDVPVRASEETLEEVRSVAQLVDNMLETAIEKEIQHLKAASNSLSRILYVAVAAEAMMVLLSFWVAREARGRLARSIHAPIAHLELFTAELVAGKLQTRVPATSVAELSNLTDQVNVMAQRMEALIAQNRREQENLKKAELRTLQAQINPHFLYNTLDTILWEAEAGKNDTVIALTKSLSDFFRISLSSGEDWVTVAQETRHLEGYLSIQKTRYRDILDYHVDIDPSLANCVILKLLLQPLVENALYHGIKNRRGGGVITVTGIRMGNQMRFAVQDTGQGMTEERLAEVRSHLRTGAKLGSPSAVPGAGSGYGLYNVHQRICLYYGVSEGLEINSGREGTTVHFLVSVKGKGEHDYDQRLSGG